MAIELQWMNPQQTLILMQFKRGWAWAELYDAVRDVDQRIGSVAHTVHVLLDLTHAGRLPLDFMQVAGELFASGDARPNEGLRIIVGANWLLRSAYNTLSKLYASKLAERPILFADNLDEAHVLLRSAP